MSMLTREVFDEAFGELPQSASEPSDVESRVRLLACPAHDESDRLSLEMLVARLPADRWEVRTVSVETLTAELLAAAAAFEPQVIVIGSLPPDGPAHSRYLCKRLRARFPDAHILVGRWGELSPDREAWIAVGASDADASLVDALTHLQSWQPVFEADEATPAVRRPAKAAANC